MANVNPPTIIYPNGGEVIVTPTLTILWAAPAVLDVHGRPVWFEIFFDTEYASNDEPDWRLIATLASTATSFVWNVPLNLRSSHTRFAVRTRNSIGELSSFSISAADLTINRASLPFPQVVSPATGNRYDTIIKIIVADQSIPQKGYYHFSYSSSSANVPRSTIAPRVPASSMPFRWNTASLPAANDYIFYAMSVDRDGNSSEPAVIRDIQVVHEGFFVVDTLPPQTSITISNDTLFTNTTQIGVNVYAYDEATGVHSMQVKELKPDSTDLNAGTTQIATDSASYTLSTGDGAKLVSVLNQDFGANRNFVASPSSYRIFTDVLGRPNDSANAMAFTSLGDSELVFAATDEDGVGIVYEIEQYPQSVGTLQSQTINLLAAFESQAYVASIDVNQTGHILKSVVGGFVTVYDFTLEGENVSGLAASGSFLYWGTNMGKFFKYDGSQVQLVTDISTPIRAMSGDGSAVYFTSQDGSQLWSYDGSTLTQVAL